MSSLANRLRGIVGPLPPKGGSHVDPCVGDVSPDEGAISEDFVASAFSRKNAATDAAEILGGEWRELRGQRFLVIDRKYPPGHRHGDMAVADTLPPNDSCWSRFALLNGTATDSSRGGRVLFIDLETTGLAGGAGTYAFLVGCAWYQDAALRVRQFFLSNFASERVLLEAVAEVADACGVVVTYNGKSFDVPLIETRFLLHRLETPFAGVPHVDMLHPARRLWRPADGEESLGSGEGAFVRRSAHHEGGLVHRSAQREGGCRLGVLEQALCGHVREGDVPGFQIPSRYFHFVHSGDARGLEAVMEHNRLDLISLAMLTARASQLLEDGPHAARTGREALGMGRLYERAGLLSEARAAFLCSAEHHATDTATRAEAWRAFAVISRRQRRFADAADGWRQILGLPHCPSAIYREAAEALAVHHEHRVRDLQTARAFALQSLNVGATRARHDATQHRLARLDRKLGDSAAFSASLF